MPMPQSSTRQAGRRPATGVLDVESATWSGDGSLNGLLLDYSGAMRAFFLSILGYFLSPAGIVLMGILDASMVFFLPLGIDFVVIIMTARRPGWFALYALLATVGSVIGAAATFWIGRQAGEKGLSRFVGAGRLRRVKARVDRGAFVVAALALIPPPFPFTPFVLASGALGMNPWSFFGGLAAVRLFRFGLEAGLAARYGRGILGWMTTPTFRIVVGIFIAIAIVGTIASAVAMARSRRAEKRLANVSRKPPVAS
jgi:membrane protein YqaA with SNARE-associated domain